MNHITFTTVRTFGAGILAAALTLAASPASAETKVKNAYVKNGKLVLEVVEEPARSASVEVEIGGQKMTVPVSGLIPNRTRTVTTSFDVPCGNGSSLQASVEGGSTPYSKTLSYPCPTTSGGGSRSGSTGSTGSGSAPALDIFDLQVARTNGLLGVYVRTQGPAPRTPVEVEFSYADFTEKARVVGLAPNRNAKANGRQPFPCNETHRVRARIATPGYGDQYVEADLSRTCSKSQGTPNLVPYKLERANNMRTNAFADNRVPVRVEVINDSQYDMPFNNQGTPSFFIQVPGISQRMQVRRQLQAGEKWGFNVSLTLSCWSNEADRFQEVTMTVDSARNIRESDENDNQKTFVIEANRCRDAG